MTATDRQQLARVAGEADNLLELRPEAGTEQLIPGNPVELHRIGKQLGKATHVLVKASRQGKFPPVVRVGKLWFVSLDAVRAWFADQHAKYSVTPRQRERIRHAGRKRGLA